MHVAVTHVQSALVALKQKPLLGGWQETFEESATETDGDLFLKGIQLSAATILAPWAAPFIRHWQTQFRSCLQWDNWMSGRISSKAFLHRWACNVLRCPIFSVWRKNVNLAANSCSVCSWFRTCWTILWVYRASDRKNCDLHEATWPSETPFFQCRQLSQHFKCYVTNTCCKTAFSWRGEMH